MMMTKVHKSTMSHVVYGCDTWSLTLREQRLRVLWGIFGTREEKNRKMEKTA
jgi:hypothetical protein